jgi:hypothetical protein
MKSKMKQTKIDPSAAKWLPRAMALAATTASSQAATVQITLTGNKISTTGGDQLNADLTRDGLADIIVYASGTGTSGVSAWVQDLGGAGGGFVSASYTDTTFYVDARFLGGVGSEGGSGPAPRSASYLNPVTFTDPGINNGAPTGGWLQVNAFNSSATNHTVELARLIFDTESTTRPSFTSIPGVQTEWVAAVPEPGSNLALLALGAGGLTLRRRLKRAA